MALSQNFTRIPSMFHQKIQRREKRRTREHLKILRRKKMKSERIFLQTHHIDRAHIDAVTAIYTGVLIYFRDFFYYQSIYRTFLFALSTRDTGILVYLYYHIISQLRGKRIRIKTLLSPWLWDKNIF